MIYSHVIKKVRKNISKSGKGAYKDLHSIHQNHRYSAHVWDVSKGLRDALVRAAAQEFDYPSARIISRDGKDDPCCC
jgi:hypothetical protein